MMKLKDFIAKKESSIEKNSSFKKLFTKIKKNSLEYVVVLKNKKPIGVISSEKVLQILLDKEPIDANINPLIHKEFVKISTKHSTKYAYELIQTLNVKFLVLVDKKDRYVGIIKSYTIICNYENRSCANLDIKSLFLKPATFIKDTLSVKDIVDKDQVFIIKNSKNEIKSVIAKHNLLEYIDPKRGVETPLDFTTHKKPFFINIEDNLVEILHQMHDDNEKVAIVYIKSKKLYYTISLDEVILSLTGDRRVLNGELMKSKQTNYLLEIMANRSETLSFIKDINLKYIKCNQAILDFFDFTKEEVIGSGDYDLFPKPTADLFNSSDKEVLEKCEKIKYIRVLRGIVAEITIEPIFDEFNNCIGIVGFIKDVTFYKLQAQKDELMQNVFDNSGEGILVIDKNLHILTVNPTYTKISGYSQEELVGKKPSIITSDEFQDGVFEKIRNAIRRDGIWRGEIANKRKNGEKYNELITISTMKNKNNEVTGYMGIVSDNSALKKEQDKLNFIARHDILTSLPNRFSFETSLQEMINKARRQAFKIGILYFDLDNFKEINDTFGHSMGDKVLMQVSLRLRKVLRKDDVISRVGGDEFVVLINNCKSEEKLQKVIEKIFHVFEYPFIIDSEIFNITCSMGSSIYPDNGEDAETLVKNADAAMYKAKKSGRNSHCKYTNDITDTLVKKIEILSEIRKGIANDEFFIYYQPQIDMKEDKIVGIEALIRWNSPRKGMIYPDEFIPTAEENQLIIPIGKQILKKACEDIKIWLDLGINLDTIKIAINVSPVQLANDDIFENIKEATNTAGIDPKYLEIEITESSIMSDPDSAIELFKRLQTIGVSVSIDDFGTGYSSLSYLKKFSINQLKIDRSFIMEIPDNKDDIAITKAILAICKSLDIDVIAEGVEDQKQKNFLLEHGCVKAQGYFYSPPISRAELEEKYIKLNKF